MKNQFLTAKFYKTVQGNEPVREWLKSLSTEEKKKIGEEIQTVQFGWASGMPLKKKLVEKLDKDIWEIKINFKDKIARVLFAFYNKEIIMLHGFIKKSQKTPKYDLDLAKTRFKEITS